MTTLADKTQQIIQVHAGLIYRVARACENPQYLKELESLLKEAEANSWTDLVAAIRKILAGNRSENILAPLDEEDRVIVDAILRGLQDPSTLPPPQIEADPSQAAPGLAHMIYAASSGNPEALQQTASMADQMIHFEGNMARLGGIMKRLIDGERDPDILCKGMDQQGGKLVLKILEELGKLNQQ